jgi:hypothetical protein
MQSFLTGRRKEPGEAIRPGIRNSLPAFPIQTKALQGVALAALVRGSKRGGNSALANEFFRVVERKFRAVDAVWSREFHQPSKRFESGDEIW